MTDDTGTETKFSRFQMFTDEANGAVGYAVSTLIREARAALMPIWRADLINRVNTMMASIALIFPEVHDTEPEWAIVDEVNMFCDEVDLKRISRDDLS